MNSYSHLQNGGTLSHKFLIEINTAKLCLSEEGCVIHLTVVRLQKMKCCFCFFVPWYICCKENWWLFCVQHCTKWVSFFWEGWEVKINSRHFPSKRCFRKWPLLPCLGCFVAFRVEILQSACGKTNSVVQIFEFLGKKICKWPCSWQEDLLYCKRKI